ncbi:MAG: M20/M25/M40 family metallo-hydrolase [Deltaproteobacteria bacterium]|nr:M20/M25/M40 family metallo-hydrolase [Deltaproteobacteria bacterium]
MSYPQIINDFLEMVTTPSHSRNERALSDLVRKKLLDLGCEVTEDDAGPKFGGNSGNLLARFPGESSIEPIMFSAHLDRVNNPGRIAALVKTEEDRIVSDGTTILGADDASGLAAIVDGLRRSKAGGARHGEVELVVTVGEEIGLQGSRHLDYAPLRSKMAYVLDSGGDVGTIVNRAPTQKTVTISVQGLSSHAGMAPEAGINAIRVAAAAMMKLPEGRLSPVTTSNFGVIEGGKATNIVCDFVKLKAEARSHDAAELERYTDLLNRTFRETAAEYKTTVELDWVLEYEAFYVPEDERVVALARRAFDGLGLETKIMSGGGGMDGNHFNKNGIKSVGLSTGYKHVHTQKEEQSISQLILCGEAVARIIEAAVSV